ncbi:MAG: hypothetical protein K6F53_06795 [Lachnospiraceae bacterium]|nr:hypothetical protein [Lachnospiraceae bacterium]
MMFFSKKETIELFSEQQKDDYIEKLDRANVSYVIKEKEDSSFGGNIHYLVKVNASDLKKVV